jgi:hypothetical protein
VRAVFGLRPPGAQRTDAPYRRVEPETQTLQWSPVGYLAAMSTVQEIEAVRAWIDDFLEDQLELKDEVKAKLDESRREIAAGDYRVCSTSLM